MAKHNATGRSVQPSKSQRQQALARATAPQQSVVTQTPAPQPTPEPTPAPATTATVVAISTKGAAMRSRWGACLKARPGAALLMPADIKALPRESIITSLVPGNPKRRMAETRYAKYGFNMVKGATTTIAKYVEALSGGNRPLTTESVALADIAWDINHAFIQVDVVNAAAPPEAEQPEETTQATIDAEPIDPTEDAEPEPVAAEAEQPRPTDAWATVNEAPADTSEAA
jgi:hypothetical protein